MLCSFTMSLTSKLSAAECAAYEAAALTLKSRVATATWAPVTSALSVPEATALVDMSTVPSAALWVTTAVLKSAAVEEDRYSSTDASYAIERSQMSRAWPFVLAKIGTEKLWPRTNGCCGRTMNIPAPVRPAKVGFFSSTTCTGSEVAAPAARYPTATVAFTEASAPVENHEGSIVAAHAPMPEAELVDPQVELTEVPLPSVSVSFTLRPVSSTCERPAASLTWYATSTAAESQYARGVLRATETRSASRRSVCPPPPTAPTMVPAT